ncbi:glycosyltransferase [Streptomyces sp. ST2-7A]|uniref:glycosyltransferase n=1 Tax=Streptomyces sp. ST2-7A TaxID=2907214 RepID=UPI001F3BE36B|nr:glycosyltransferase [Streptomyces sp. ST2-7A]MCE7083279.1 glycosyltransferase [Streptomyces sp. ST2-7A]
MSEQSAHPECPRHVVTAVLVSHDGARWLPDVLAGLTGQERPVQDVIAADTGSADESAALLAETLGPDRVLHLARRTSFGTAVSEAHRTAPVLGPDDLPYLRRPEAWNPATRSWDTSVYDLPELPHGEPVHWLWLLHDDAAPEPDALAHLLREADEYPDAVVLGGKLRSWYDSRQLLETGVSIASSGRRWTGLERREQDQGQHDGTRRVLSVSSAGMLVRRDVFEKLGGFDRRLPLMRDDVDLCWRARAAGHDVLVVPSAVLRHAEASARERRSIDCAGRLGGSPHRVDKAGAVHTLLANTPGRRLPWVLLRLVVGTLLRVVGYLLAKQPGRSLDEIGGLLAVLLRPERVLAGRRSRARAAAPDHDPADLRPLFPVAGATVKLSIDQAMSATSGRFGSGDSGNGGRHGGVESGPSDDDADSLEVEQFGRVRRLVRRPGPVLFLLLLLASLFAGRALLGGGALGGGALLPAPADAGELWARYLESWQPLGIGGTVAAPPWIAFLATLGTIFLGSLGPVLTLLFVLAVPLAGISAYLCAGPLVPSRVLRAWGAVAYALLPAVTGAVASGRVGTVLLAVLLPPLARAALAALGPGAAPGPWRATWAAALLLTVTTAFTPVVWLLAAVLGVIALVVAVRPGGPAVAARGAVIGRFAAVLLTPLPVLSPWFWRLLLDPSRLFREAGVAPEIEPATAFQLLTLSPGGPGTTGAWVLVGLLLAALAALLRTDRRTAIGTAWTVALVALPVAVWANTDEAAWPGPATLLAGLALIGAAMVGADGARHRVAEQSFGWRQPVAVLIAVAAVLGPLFAAGAWMLRGADGPLERGNPGQVPAFVAEESGTGDRARTLVLAGEGEDADGAPLRVDYTVLRGSGARLGDADITDLMPGDGALDRAVGELVAGSGADQTRVLAGYAVRYVIVRDGSPEEIHRVLDTTPGLKRLSQEDGSALWRVERVMSRVVIVPPGDETADWERVPAGPITVDTEIPAGPAGRVLRLADASDPGWSATLDGEPLTRTRLDGWAQGFELPENGGRLVVSWDSGTLHTGWVWTQGFLLLVLAVLALPGRRRELDDDLPEPEAAPVGGRRAARAAAAAAAAGGGADAAGPDDRDGADAPVAVPGPRPGEEPEFDAFGTSGPSPAAVPGPRAGEPTPADAGHWQETRRPAGAPAEGWNGTPGWESHPEAGRDGRQWETTADGGYPRQAGTDPYGTQRYAGEGYPNGGYAHEGYGGGYTDGGYGTEEYGAEEYGADPYRTGRPEGNHGENPDANRGDHPPDHDYGGPR